MDPQAFWNEVFIKTLVKEVSMMVSLQDLMVEPMVALPQFQKLRCHRIQPRRILSGHFH